MKLPDALAPYPTPTAETREFWEGCARHELLFQRCGGCGAAQFYPRPVCVICHTTELVWEKSTGHGMIVSFTIVERAPSTAFRKSVPYVLVLVDFAEGFRMMMNLRTDSPSDLRIGQPVSVFFEEQANGSVLPQAREHF